MDYLATYFSTEGKLPANTNVFQYDKEGPFDIKYYVETISNKTPELNATANIYLVYYGNGASQYSRNFTTFPIGRGIQLNNFQSNMSASYKIGNTSFRAIGKGAYAILTVVNQPSLDKKLMLIDNFYVTDEEWICNNIQFKDNKRKHVNLRENAEPTLFGRRHDYEFLRYLQFYLATLIEDTDYITNEKVSLHYTIDEKGDVTDIEVKNCSTPWIAKQLQKIAYGCPKFTPKMVDGVPQASRHELVVPVSMDYE
ncbi:hypothetical protein MY04_4142 [Flammeovirga sp. MY04]|uniref:hypothetical protein n=1 Tax=Flammeovirga sp. MY04 TaxID=1191459 RepID=UPI00082564C2|nr:hypothetical protein [Flammeovirga sp. MY04]ANQ51486.2 hypothetical protein MY04_4142 [Flammeovirga sp. MY04]